MTAVRPAMLIILDGWGVNAETENNAVAMANTPYIDSLFESYPHTTLNCAGPYVGLPEGIMGNSEVGHLNIGAGRTVYQTLLRIDKSIEDGLFSENPALVSAMESAKEKDSTLHLMGLVSDGGVHSQLSHLMALIDLAKSLNVKSVKIHAILDGRDTPPDSGKSYVTTLQDYVADNTTCDIASICGRFYAMDRDTRWERTEIAYELYTQGVGRKEEDPVSGVETAYAQEETDEFVKPVVLPGFSPVQDDDAVIFFNFRADRARQITRAFTVDTFDGFERKKVPALADYVCMSLYDETFDLEVAFGPVAMTGLLGEAVANEGLHQLRIAETEKYAHITYFFNGGKEAAFENEKRCLIPSPREAETYDKIPEMSAVKVADEAVERIESGKYSLIVLNFANMDMVGHTGILSAAVKAAETVDTCVRKVVTAFIEKTDGAVVLTADHGNAEMMLDENGGVHTAHTLNPVPLILIDNNRKSAALQSGALQDIAPTVIELMGIAKPEPMTGASLIVSSGD